MKHNINQRYINLLLCVAMLAMLIAAILPIFGIKWEWLRYAFAAAAVLTLVAQLLPLTQARALEPGDWRA